MGLDLMAQKGSQQKCGKLYQFFAAYVLITLIEVVASAWVSNIVGNLSGYYMPTPRVVSRRAMCS